MPKAGNGFWSRLAAAFRPCATSTSATDLPEVGDDGLLAEPAHYPDPGGEDIAAERSGNPLTRWSKRDQTIARLQEGYDKVNQVVEEIQKHLAQQGERTDRICTSLEQLARAMSDMPAVARQQGQSLEAMAGALETGNARMKQIVDAMDEIPKVSRTQTEALTGIKRQLEVSGEQNLVASQTMERLSTAITSLGDLGTAQFEALRQMSSKTDTQAEVLHKLVARQSKRFTMLFIVTVVLAAAAITVAIVGLAARG